MSADYFCDACYQALAYWIMSALSNDPFTLARFAGMYKVIQSAGAAGSFGMDAVLTPLVNEHLASWIMMLVSFPLAFIVIRSIKETNYESEHMDYVEDLHKDQAEQGQAREKRSESRKLLFPRAHASPHVIVTCHTQLRPSSLSCALPSWRPRPGSCTSQTGSSATRLPVTRSSTSHRPLKRPARSTPGSRLRRRRSVSRADVPPDTADVTDT